MGSGVDTLGLTVMDFIAGTCILIKEMHMKINMLDMIMFFSSLIALGAQLGRYF